MEEFVSGRLPGDVRLLIIEAESGLGKSTLLRKFRTMVDEDPSHSQTKLVDIDLQAYFLHELWFPLVAIRNGLARFGVRFPAFDLGFELYATSVPERPMVKLESRWLSQSRTAIAESGGEGGRAAVVEVSKALSEGTFTSVPFVGKILANLTGYAFNKLHTKYIMSTNAILGILLIDGTAKKRPPSEILGYLPRVLAWDIACHVESSGDSLMVWLDQTDSIVSPTIDIKDRRVDLVNLLLEELSSSVRFVVAGTSCARIAPHVTRDNLGGLDLAAARKFLKLSGVPDDEHAPILGCSAFISAGLEAFHPLALDVNVRRFQNAAIQGRALVPGEQGRGGELVAIAVMDLLAHNGEALTDTLSRLAICDRFDEDLFMALDGRFGMTRGSISWSDVRGMPFLVTADNGKRIAFALSPPIKASILSNLSPAYVNETSLEYEFQLIKRLTELERGR